MKRTLPLIITGLAGIVLIVSYFIPVMQVWGEEVTVWFDILAAIAFILGGGNLLKVQLETISSRRPGWGYALVILVSFAIMLTVGLLKIGVPPAEQYPNHPWSGEYDAPASAFGWIFENVYNPLTSTMFALLAFYVASAAFRAFRAKNIEAMLLLGTAFVVLLGNTAIARLTDGIPDSLSFLRLDQVVANTMSYITTGAFRAITIGIAIGVAATALRVLLGIDRPYLGRS